MANGIAGLRPFPTFGDKTGGITPVNLAPTTPRFPVARPINVAPAREDVDPFRSYIAPIGLGLLANKFFGGKTETLPVPDEEASDLVKAEYLAQQIYGPKRKQTTGQRIGQIATQYLPALFTDNDKELAAFMQTTTNLDKARSDRTKLTDTSRQNFIAQQLKDEPDTRVTLVDQEKARYGIMDIRQGKFDPKKGYFVLNDDRTEYVNVLELPDTNFVDVKVLEETLDFNKLDKVGLSKFDELDLKIQEQDTNTLRFLVAGNSALDLLQEGIDDPAMNPTSLVANLGNAADSVLSNFEQIFVATGGERLFATPVDVSQGIGGSIDQQGTGQNALALVLALRSGNQAEIDAAIEQFDKSGAMAEATGGEFSTIKETLGDLAFANVRTKSLLLQLAYSAAATAGQTGRTLSDKDLAFFLQQIGFGATQNAEVLYSNLTQFIEKTIEQNDAGLASTLAIGRLPRFKTGNKYSDRMLNLFEYYFDFEDGQDTSTYKRKNFADRFRKEEVYQEFINRPRYRKTDGSTTTKDQPENILDFKLNVEDI